VKFKEYRRLAEFLARTAPVRLAHGISAEGWARAAALLGVAAVAMAFAQLTWLLVPRPAERLPSASSATHQPGKGSGPISISELIDGHLFGSALVQPGGAINAPETTLNLTLRGIFALDSQRALAIIASGGANEQPYKVGDTLPGGALVHEIAPDKVILERSGRFETLTLPKETLNNGGMPETSASAASTVSPSARLGDIRNRLRANPVEAVGLNAVQPVMENGQLKGYQLGDNPYMPALREAGLMPGDVVTRVNGIAVTDQARAAEVVNQLSTAGHVDLEVERGGTPITISVNLGK